MKVGISTACFYPEINTEDALKVIKELGFDICEVFLEAEYEMTYDYCLELREKADNLGLTINTIHPFSAGFEPFLFDKYPRRRKEMESKFKMTCRAGELLRAEYYIFHGLRKTNENINPVEIAQEMDYFCNLAKDHNIKLAWENVSWCRTSEPNFIQSVQKYMKEEIFINLDIKQAVRSGHSPFEYINIYHDRIVNVHINDSNHLSTCLLPGEGDINIKGIRDQIKMYNENTPYIIEVYSENFKSLEDIKRAKEYLENLR